MVEHLPPINLDKIYSKFYENSYDRVMPMCRNFVGDDAAEDVFHDAWEKIWKIRLTREKDFTRIFHVEAQEKDPMAYIRKICKSKCLDRIRNQKKHIADELQTDLAIYTSDHIESKLTIEQILSSLSPKDRRLYVLRYEEKLKYEGEDGILDVLHKEGYSEKDESTIRKQAKFLGRMIARNLVFYAKEN